MRYLEDILSLTTLACLDPPVNFVHCISHLLGENCPSQITCFVKLLTLELSDPKDEKPPIQDLEA